MKRVYQKATNAGSPFTKQDNEKTAGSRENGSPPASRRSGNNYTCNATSRSSRSTFHSVPFHTFHMRRPVPRPVPDVLLFLGFLVFEADMLSVYRHLRAKAGERPSNASTAEGRS